MSFGRGTYQCTGYQTKNSEVIHQVARRQAPAVVTADQRSVIYDLYDLMMLNLMGEIFKQTLVSADGNSVDIKPIRRTLATPDRAFASMARQLKVPLQEVPLPFGSLMSMEGTYDGERDNRAVVRQGLNYDSTQVQMHEYPYPSNIPYTFTIWCRTINDGRSFYEQCCLAGWYQDYLYVNMNLPRRMGDVLIRLEWVGTDQQDDLEPGSDKNRLIQKVFNFTVFAWIPRRTIDRPAVLAAQLEKFAVRTTADLDNVQDDDIVEHYGTDTLFDERQEGA